MVNEKYMKNFEKNIDKRTKQIRSDPPKVDFIGEGYDHDKGMMSDLKLRLVPFSKESYQASEWAMGQIPLKDPAVPKLYFQATILNIKNKSVPGIATFGAVVDAPVKETYVVTWSKGLKNYLLPLSVIADETVPRKKAYLEKINWTPFVEAVNTDKKAVKTLQLSPSRNDMGKFSVNIDTMRLVGTHQVMPFKGKTLLLMNEAGNGNVNKPAYRYQDVYEAFWTLSSKIKQHPATGEDVGTLFITDTNKALFGMMINDAER
jgi:hypothetical protein